MSRKYFGTDGVRGTVGEVPITPEFVLRLGQAAGRALTSTADGTSAGRPDRQGHAHLGLHARGGARGRAVERRRRRRAVRPVADARRRVSHARAPARRRHRHQRLAQSVSGQRHQVLLGARQEAARCGRGGDRGRARQAAALRQFEEPRQGAPARRRRRPLHRVLQAHLSERARPEGPEDRGRQRARRRVPRRAARLPRTRRRGDLARRDAQRHEHQRRRGRAPRAAPRAGRPVEPRPMSASRSTATRTAS